MSPEDTFRTAETAIRNGQLSEAATLYNELLGIADWTKIALNGLAEIELHKGRFAESVNLLKKSLAIDPKQPRCLEILGLAQQRSGQPEEALHSYNVAIQLGSERDFLSNVHCNRAILLADHFDNLDQALNDCNKAVRVSGNFAYAFFCRAKLLARLNQPHNALSDYDRAIELQPQYSKAYLFRGLLRAALKQHDMAISDIDRAIELSPRYAEAYWSKGELLLQKGRYEEAWDYCEWRLRTRFARKLKGLQHVPFWSGQENISGKTLLLRSDGGFGDDIMFIRYVSRVLDLGARAIVHARQPLTSLFAALQDEQRNIAVLNDKESVDEANFQCFLRSLPCFFKTTLLTIPNSVPYLKIPDERRKVWHRKLSGDKFRIGLAWSGARRKVDSVPFMKRTIPLFSILRLLQFRAEFHSLQQEVSHEDHLLLLSNPHINRHDDELRDFADTAALIDKLDLVISIDGVIANLAGALAKPVCVLLPYSADFRWMADGTRTPWYPTAKLFRQHQIGDWDTVVSHVESELKSHNLKKFSENVQ